MYVAKYTTLACKHVLQLYLLFIQGLISSTLLNMQNFILLCRQFKEGMYQEFIIHIRYELLIIITHAHASCVGLQSSVSVTKVTL